MCMNVYFSEPINIARAKLMPTSIYNAYIYELYGDPGQTRRVMIEIIESKVIGSSRIISRSR